MPAPAADLQKYLQQLGIPGLQPCRVSDDAIAVVLGLNCRDIERLVSLGSIGLPV
jgi:hypothetical protein